MQKGIKWMKKKKDGNGLTEWKKKDENDMEI